MENSEHLKFIHDRIINVYKEDENIDFLIKFREIISELEKQEKSFNDWSLFKYNY